MYKSCVTNCRTIWDFSYSDQTLELLKLGACKDEIFHRQKEWKIHWSQNSFFFLSKILQSKTIMGDWRVKSENFGLGALWVEIFHLKWKKFLKKFLKIAALEDASHKVKIKIKLKSKIEELKEHQRKKYSIEFFFLFNSQIMQKGSLVLKLLFPVHIY